MNKSELITKIASSLPRFTHTDAKQSISVLLDAISNHLSAGGRVEVRGFSSFSPRSRRTGGQESAETQ